ncbi:hypothetical protein ACWEWI_38940 [Streptomyces sp. NPDC003753]
MKVDPAVPVADRHLRTLSCDLLRSSQAAEHIAGIADDPVDIDGALHFGCLLNLARKPEGALWSWQYAAGSGNATAAYCLHLLHLGRGELRDADHWMRQAHLVAPQVDRGTAGSRPAMLLLPANPDERYCSLMLGFGSRVGVVALQLARMSMARREGDPGSVV